MRGLHFDGYVFFMVSPANAKVICYNAIIQACGEGQWRRALQAFEELQQQMVQFFGPTRKSAKKKVAV